MNNKQDNQANKVLSLYKNIMNEFCIKLEVQSNNGNMYFPEQHLILIKNNVLTKISEPQKFLKVSYDRIKIKEKLEKQKKQRDQQLKLQQQMKKMTQVKIQHQAINQQPQQDFDDQLFNQHEKKVIVKQQSIAIEKKQQCYSQDLSQDRQFEEKNKRIDQANQQNDMQLIGSFQSRRKKYTAKTEKTKMYLQNIFVKTRQRQICYREIECQFTTLNYSDLIKKQKNN